MARAAVVAAALLAVLLAVCLGGARAQERQLADGLDYDDFVDKRAAYAGPLIRFGKRAGMQRTIRIAPNMDPFIRFGKRAGMKRLNTSPLIRFGKRNPFAAPHIRFGKRDEEPDY